MPQATTRPLGAFIRQQASTRCGGSTCVPFRRGCCPSPLRSQSTQPSLFVKANLLGRIADAAAVIFLGTLFRLNPCLLLSVSRCEKPVRFFDAENKRVAMHFLHFLNRGAVQHDSIPSRVGNPW